MFLSSNETAICLIFVQACQSTVPCKIWYDQSDLALKPVVRRDGFIKQELHAHIKSMGKKKKKKKQR